MSRVATVLVALLLTACTSNERPEPAPEPTPEPTQPEAEVAQRPWDPRDVDELPAAAADVASGLPEVLEMPDAAPELAATPVDSAVLTVYGEDALFLLGTDGTWRRVPPPSAGSGATLTRDGTRLAVERGDGVDVWDLPTGERTRVEAPRGHRPWDYSSWQWVDDDSLLLDDAGGGWRVSTISPSADAVPFPSRTSFFWTVDADGAVVESAGWGHPSVLTDWADGMRRRVDMSPTGRLASIQVDADTVVGTSYENGPFAVYVADRSDLAPRAVLPVNDHEANYSNGGLSVLALLDDGTVLLRVAVFKRPDSELRIVAWDPDTDELSLVTRTIGSAPLGPIAQDLLE